ncbi:MAG: hypothetical protein GX992_02020 [Clostridium sp.]|nr:hypothetical protein [Clostridium sp.]
MDYLQRSFKFLGRFLMVSLPIIALTIISGILQGIINNSSGIAELMENIIELSSSGNASSGEIQSMLSENIGVFLMAIALYMGIGIAISFFTVPPTYGMINKGLSEGNVSLGDYFPQMFKNFTKYVTYYLATLVLGLICATALSAVVLLPIIALTTAKSSAVMIISIVGTFLLLGVIAIVFTVINTFLSYVFPAMVVDDLQIISAIKRAFEIGKSYFWPTLGIRLLVGLGAATISSVLGVPLGMFAPPLIVGIITVLPSALAEVILNIFSIIVYRSKTGKEQVF